MSETYENGYCHISLTLNPKTYREFRHICNVNNVSYSRMIQTLMNEYVSANKELLKIPPTVSKLVTARKNAGMTQVDLAKAVGCDQARISRYESGKWSPCGDMKQRIADALSCDASDIF